jgi:prepilin-type processing-associated H-X9-DG protein
MSAPSPACPPAANLAQRLLLLILFGVLASLVVPALEGLRSQARASRCANNLRLIGAGIHAFAAEHNGMVVPYRGESIDPPTGSGRLWTESLTPYCAPEITSDGKPPALPFGSDYAKDERFFYMCPDSPVPVLWRTWGNYALHPIIMKSTGLLPPNFPLSRIVRPAQAILIADGSVTTDTGLVGGSADNGSGQYFDKTYPFTATPEPSNLLQAPIPGETANPNADGITGWIRYRHQGRANCLHADGHVRAYAYADRTTEMTYARFVSGR